MEALQNNEARVLTPGTEGAYYGARQGSKRSARALACGTDPTADWSLLTNYTSVLSSALVVSFVFMRTSQCQFPTKHQTKQVVLL